MHLHFVLPQLEPLYGMELAAVVLMQNLREHGVEISATVLSRGVPAGLKGIEVVRLDAGDRITRLVETVPALRRRLRALPAATEIVASGLWGSVPVSAALSGSGRSFVAWEHSLLPERLRIDRRVRALARISRLGPLRPRLVVGCSKGVARTVQQLSPQQKVAHIPHPMPPTEFIAPRPVGDPDRVRLITTGALRPNKNHSCAIAALALLPARYQLVLAGDGEERKLLENQVQELGLNDRVAFLGRIPEVRKVLADSDLLVHPSRSETFGFSLTEAAEEGIPVATLPFSAMDELVPHLVPGAMASEPTPEALASVILHLTGDGRPTVADFEQAWRDRSAKFAPATVSRQWVEALGA